MSTKLDRDQIERALADLPGWRYENGELIKWFRFDGFPQAIAFLQRLVDPAERLNHHPDIENHYDRVRIALHTWTEQGVTEKDLALAAEVERAAAEPRG